MRRLMQTVGARTLDTSAGLPLPRLNLESRLPFEFLSHLASFSDQLFHILRLSFLLWTPLMRFRLALESAILIARDILHGLVRHDLIVVKS